MKLKIALLVVLVGMSLTVAAARQPNPGTLGPPENFLVTQNATSLFFSWDPVDGATKYTIPVKGTLTFSDGQQRYQVPFEYEFNTDGRIGTVSMRSGKMVLEIPDEAMAFLLKPGIQSRNVDPDDVVGLQLAAVAKIKAMNPGRGNGPQNNPFSDEFSFNYTKIRR